MPLTTKRVYRIDDATLAKVLSEIGELFPDKPANAKFVMVQGISLNSDEVSKAHNLAGRYSFNEANFSITPTADAQLHINFRRGIKLEKNGTIEPSARYDEFDINFGGRSPAYWNENKTLVSDVLTLVTSLGAVPPEVNTRDDEVVLHELVRSVNETHKQMLGSLDNSLNASIERRIELESEADQKEAKRQKKHEEELKELSAEREKLQLQSYRSERRRIMQELTNEKALNQRRDLAPKGSIWVRWAVFAASVLLGLISFYITSLSITQLGTNDNTVNNIISGLSGSTLEIDPAILSAVVGENLNTTNWYLIIRSVFSSLVGIGAFAYAAAWLRTFYDGEVASARAIDQYNQDLVRASWVIETVLEVKQEHDSVVPNHWIEGVTRGLFTDSGPQTTSDEGVQALKALLGFTASASFGPDGPKVELNQKGAKKLAGK